MRPQPALSLPAELLLLSTDPVTLEPYPTKGRRRRAAFAAAAVQEGIEPMPHGGWDLRRAGRRAERDARAELAECGLLGDDGRLADAAPLQRHHEWLARQLASGGFEFERDRALVAVLAYAGVLEPRLRDRDPGWLDDVTRSAVDPLRPNRAVRTLALDLGGNADAVLSFLRR